MKKEVVIKHIANYLNTLLEELNVELALKLEGSAVQCSDVNDIDSHAHQFQVIKEEQGVKHRIDAVLKDREYFQKTQVVQTNKVQEGALIKIKNYFLYIGVPTPAITIQNKKVIGISTSAPIYKSLANKKVGFKFKINDVNCVIESIH